MKPLDIRSVAANVAIKGAAAGLAFASQIVLVKMLGPAGYGELVLFITLCSLLGVVGKMGLDVSLVRLSALAHSRQDEASLRFLAIEGSLAAVLGSLVACTCYAVAIPFLGSVGNFASGGTALVFACVTLMSVAAVLGAVSRGRLRILRAEFTESIVRPVLMLLALTALLAGAAAEPGWEGPLAYTLAQAAVCAVLCLGLVPRGPFRFPDRIRWRALTFPPPGSGSLIGLGLIGFAMFQLDTLLLGLYRPMDDVGSYNMACNLARLVIFVPMILAGQAQPLLAVAWKETDSERYFAIVRSIILRSLLAAGLGAALLLVLGEWLLGAIHPRLATASGALRILAIAHCFNAVSIVASAALYMAGLETLVMRAQSLGAALAVAGYFVLIPRLGLEGAAMSVLAALFVVFLNLLLQLQRVRRAPSRELLVSPLRRP